MSSSEDKSYRVSLDLLASPSFGDGTAPPRSAIPTANTPKVKPERPSKSTSGGEKNSDTKIIDDNMHIAARLDAMRVQEDAVHSCHNYFRRSESKDIDEGCRASMVDWCRQVQAALDLHPETVCIATSFLDRYLSSERGRSREALEDRHRFQIAFITCFYVAIKILQPTELNVRELAARLCQGYYDEEDVLSMERDILYALEGKLACPTPMEYVAHLLQLLPELDPSATVYLLETSQEYADRALPDFYFATSKPSVVGAGCLVSCLTEIDVLSSSERKSFWIKLGKMTDIVGIMYAQKKLLEGKSSSEDVAATKSGFKADKRSSSKAAQYSQKIAVASRDDHFLCA
ncbi:hypothetical protein ACHAWF_014436 [Thalassiosira exigua]